jgi:hypothetical protein
MNKAVEFLLLPISTAIEERMARIRNQLDAPSRMQQLAVIIAHYMHV